MIKIIAEWREWRRERSQTDICMYKFRYSLASQDKTRVRTRTTLIQIFLGTVPKTWGGEGDHKERRESYAVT